MAIDLDAMAPKAREKYLAIGERYATPDVLAQADKTLLGLGKYGALLTACGYGPGDGVRLAELRDKLLEHATSQIQTTGTRKYSRQAYLTTLRNAKDARLSTRTVLGMAEDDLLESGDDDAARLIGIVLKATSVEAEDVALLDQLKALYPVLAAPVVEPVVAPRGGAEILERLTRAQSSLRAGLLGRSADPERPAAGEIRDILDGMIVTSVRAARKAARVAARIHGQPAIARAFRLDLLRPSRSPEPELPPDETIDEPADEPDTTTPA